jgi:hypothetical protein
MTSAATSEEEVRRVGLCASCVHARVIENRRGSRFYRCGLSDANPTFPKYPPLPVRRCTGYRQAPPSGDAEGDSSHGAAG